MHDQAVIKVHVLLLQLTSSSRSLANGEIVKAKGIWLFLSMSDVHGTLYIVERRKAGLQLPVKRYKTYLQHLLTHNHNPS